MGKLADNSVLDAPADVIDQANLQIACTAEPTSRANAISIGLADAAMTVNTDYTKADGDTSGRKVTVAAKATQAIDASGTATHIALCDGTTLLYVTTCTSQALTSGGTVSFPAWDIEFADPT